MRALHAFRSSDPAAFVSLRRVLPSSGAAGSEPELANPLGAPQLFLYLRSVTVSMPGGRRPKARGKAVAAGAVAAGAAAPSDSAAQRTPPAAQPPSRTRGKASKTAASTGEDAGAAELDKLRREALAAVRPPTAEEKDAVARGNWTQKGMRMRREAEALLIVGDRINSAELRAQLGPRWAGVAAALDAALLDAAFGDPYSQDDSNYDGDNSMLCEYVRGKGAGQAGQEPQRSKSTAVAAVPATPSTQQQLACVGPGSEHPVTVWTSARPPTLAARGPPCRGSPASGGQPGLWRHSGQRGRPGFARQLNEEPRGRSCQGKLVLQGQCGMLHTTCDLFST